MKAVQFIGGRYTIPFFPDAPKNLQDYIEQFHFPEGEIYSVGITNADRPSLEWKYQPGKMVANYVECHTTTNAASIYEHWLEQGYEGIGEDKINNHSLLTSKVFVLGIRSEIAL